MRIFVGLLLIGLFSSAFTYNVEEIQKQQVGGWIENMIMGILEKLRTAIPETIEIPKLEFNFPGGGAVNGKANVSDFQLVGLKHFNVTYLKVSALSMAMNLTVAMPAITLNTDYFANILVTELIPIYGQGNANVHLSSVQIVLQGKVDVKKMTIKNVHVAITLGDATFDLHGLLDNEDFSTLISAVLTDTVTPFLNDHQPQISKILDPILEYVINAALHPPTPRPTTPAPTSSVAPPTQA